MLFKKEKNQQEVEKNFYHMAKKEIQDINNSLDKKSKEEIYHDICLCFKSYLHLLLNSDVSLTEEEIIIKLKKFNIEKKSIDSIENIFKTILMTDYDNKSYTKEGVLALIIDVEKALGEIDLQRRAYHLSVFNKLSRLPKDKILSNFKSNLEALKKSNLKKLNPSNDLILKLTEYYNFLPDDKKEEMSKEFHHYCNTLPELISLIDELKNAKGDLVKAELVSNLKKLFVKLDEDKKQYFYPQITYFLDEEQKVDFLLGLGYEQISRKNTENSIKIYQTLSSIYSGMDNNKKKFYQPIFLRYISSIKKAQNKK